MYTILSIVVVITVLAVAIYKKHKRNQWLETLSPRDRWRAEHGGID